LDRSARRIALTASGEQLLGYAKRMIELNDEAWGRLTSEEYEGEILIGVPHDIIYPYIPPMLRRIAVDFPRLQCKLISEPSRRLREMYARGECDIIITTEDQPGPGGEVLKEFPLVWIGAAGGVAWRRDPLPVAFCSNCIFRTGTLRRLDQGAVGWHMVVESAQDNAVEAAVSADLAITVSVAGQCPGQTEPIAHGGALPDAGTTRIILYMEQSEDPVKRTVRDLIAMSYRSRGQISSEVRLTA
jgi:DNA-binding transcriptional LysR family regulator